ncbi:Uncharacterised protein [Shigella sonnei]|nr:hypothetical protein SS323385_0636 [Shigella sonnei 3233-85]CSP94318.1 Uncharacterised protein [Shigella sonnei]
MNNSVILGEEFSVANSFVAQFHFKYINWHNDCLIHNPFSLLIMNKSFAMIIIFIPDICLVLFPYERFL